MIFNTTSAEVLDLALEKNTHMALLKQMFYALCGILLAATIWRLGYHQLVNASPLLMVVFSFLLVLCFMPWIGRKVNGSHRWISLFGFSMQPSEFVKYIIPAYLMHRFKALNPEKISFAAFLKTCWFSSYSYRFDPH